MIREYIIKISDEVMEEEIVGRPQELIRCKDCRRGEPVKNGAGEDCIQCNNDDLWFDGNVNFPDWFCADGERRKMDA